MTPPTADNDSAGRRTSLAGERTLLAWWRTALTAFAVALGVGRVVPELTPDSASWPYAVIGAGFALYGMALLLFGTARMGVLDKELRGRSEDALVLFTVAGAVLGLATLVPIVAQ